MPSTPTVPVVIRLPRTSYLAVVFLFIGAIAVAFGDSHGSLQDNTEHNGFAGVHTGWQALVFLVPLLAVVFIARTATVVSDRGISARAILGSRHMSWDDIHGLSVSGHTVYAVLRTGGSVRLPCVRIAHLGPISRLSAGRLPEMIDAQPKPAPSRPARRR